ncbi:hypothetical protein [Gordonia sp. (in: high G+C Gram-positive bacteria)]|uniref:hypothetical protein n=1 Tax=Gordonia sp. (in: high G+C Gram-positive bacteria) TaxID=84139 RepID=UPI003F9C1E85
MTGPIDWDDPRHVIRPANDGRPNFTVADVLADLEDFTEKGLRVVAWQGHTYMSLYLREKRPDLLTAEEWQKAADYERFTAQHGRPGGESQE